MGFACRKVSKGRTPVTVPSGLCQGCQVQGLLFGGGCLQVGVVLWSQDVAWRWGLLISRTCLKLGKFTPWRREKKGRNCNLFRENIFQIRQTQSVADLGRGGEGSHRRCTLRIRRIRGTASRAPSLGYGSLPTEELGAAESSSSEDEGAAEGGPSHPLRHQQ